jgi:hypothetical protein
MTREEIRVDAATNYGYAVAGGCLERPIISNAFLKGAEWADEHPMKGMVSIDDVCEWLYNHTHKHPDSEYLNMFFNVLIDDFRKTMEKL